MYVLDLAIIVMEIHRLAAAQRRGGVELLAAQRCGEVEQHGGVEQLVADVAYSAAWPLVAYLYSTARPG